jgi:hypothetical protein
VGFWVVVVGRVLKGVGWRFEQLKIEKNRIVDLWMAVSPLAFVFVLS